MEIVKIENLSKNFKNFQALKNINMNINEGDIYGFIGPNGAGKTTLIKIICGLSSQDSGALTFFGKKEKNEIIESRKKIGILVEQPALIPNFSCYQMLKMQTLILNISDAEPKINKILELISLSKFAKRKTKKLSLGMKQRLAIGLALINEPTFLILDEPTNGLDPTGIIEMRELLLKLNKEEGITILISSHILGELANLVSKVGIINHGVLLEEQSFEQLLQKSQNSVVFQTSDNEKTLNIFLQKGLNAKIINQKILVEKFNGKTSELITIIAKSDIELIDFSENKGSLEQYYTNKIKESERSC